MPWALLTVNNNISLISLNVAPSSYIASLVVLAVFVGLYLPRLSSRLARLSPQLEPNVAALPVLPSYRRLISDKPLPAPPSAASRRLLLPLPGAGDPVVANLSTGHGHAARPSRRLAAGLRAPRQSHELASLVGAPERDGHGGRRGFGYRFRRRGFWNPPLSRYRPFSPVSDDGPSEDDEVLEKAIRTRLPQGSMSPEKGRSPSPERVRQTTTATTTTTTTTATTPAVRVPRRSQTPKVVLADVGPPEQAENYIRFAVRAEVLQRTQPIEAALIFLQKQYRYFTSSWASVLASLVVALLSITTANMLVKPAAPRPVGDLVKVAGLARSFEPLIYFSEPAVAHVRELQSTSIAIWDLGESVRISGMADAGTIVQSLDAISETMKKLVLDLTRFHTHVDGDIDAILNVMDWAKMHLNRINTRPAPSHLSHAYDNIHNLLSDAQVLEDATGEPTGLGRLTTAVFGMSNPQREQRMVQRLFTAFISTLEEAIQDELEHSVSLFALFDDIDDHFLKLARYVAHESSTQDEFHAELLSGLWARMLGPRAAELRKFERNKALLHNVRHRTVRNKGNLVSHYGKLLTLKSSLESLRGKLASHLVRGLNSSTLTLEDQIRGIAGVRDYLSDIRRQQKTKVMETLYSIDRSKKYDVTPEIGHIGDDDALTDDDDDDNNYASAGL
ncbi:hypothetical protein XA68_10703 [Ophiocordyceps unilateralis]|uniref:Uncharacterized protein n=1 Tax=Ophiocordyceps unilateralis TaxID=268505 RepID=A0A2A9P166_OPHUN|nr:hypothetical protein XA68_10703 [Ophiocordyceps unilateralis]